MTTTDDVFLGKDLAIFVAFFRRYVNLDTISEKVWIIINKGVRFHWVRTKGGSLDDVW